MTNGARLLIFASAFVDGLGLLVYNRYKKPIKAKRKRKMNVRKIKREDEAEYLAMAKEFYSTDAVFKPIPEDFFKRAFEYSLVDNPYAAIIVAEENGKLLGYGTLALSYSQEAGGKVVWVEELYVKPSERGKGAGKAMFEYVFNNYPAERYRLEVEDYNKNAIRLYERLGFRFLPYEQMIKGN